MVITGGGTGNPARRRERAMTRTEYKSFIEDYLINSGVDADEFDVDGMADRMADAYDGMDAEDIDPDEFIELLEEFERTEE